MNINRIEQLKQFLQINLESNINTEHEEALFRIETFDQLISENAKLREIDSEPKLHIHSLNLTMANKDAEIEQLKQNLIALDVKHTTAVSNLVLSKENVKQLKNIKTQL